MYKKFEAKAFIKDFLKTKKITLCEMENVNNCMTSFLKTFIDVVNAHAS